MGAVAASAFCLVGGASAHADTRCADTDQTVEVVGLDRVKASTACLLREERAALGAGPVASDLRLATAARNQAQDMVSQQYFDHVGPDDRVLQTRLRAVGWIPRRGTWTAGEILAYGTGELGTPAALVDAWVHSPGHFAILRDPSYDRMGVGLVTGIPVDGDPDGVTAAVEFGRRTRG